MKKILVIIFVLSFSGALIAAPTEDKPSDGVKPTNHRAKQGK